MSSDLLQIYDQWQQRLVEELPAAIELRHRIHAEPRVSHDESDTARLVTEALGAPDVPSIAGAGRVVRIGPSTGPSIALRGELDALPIREETNVPWSSVNGAMHACGHDVHLAALVAVARAARSLPLPCALLAVLQHSEETFPSGAYELLEAGAFAGHDVRAFLGVHLQPRLAEGVAAATAGPVNASSDEFEIVVEGRGGHAGYPHLTQDPVVALAQVVVALQHIVARNVDPTRAAVITVGTLSAGSAANVVPGRAEARGSLRALHPDDREFLHRRLVEVSEQVAAAHGCRAEVRLTIGEPALVNDRRLAEACEPWLAKSGFVPGEAFRSCGADDFAYYGAAGPTLMAFVGTGSGADDSPGLHHPRFLPSDLSVHHVAQAMIAAAVAAFEDLAR
ncbi:M20 metallopeptidase family protein [Planosporangium flavigriseum]|uniref:N-acyl-L-amino acid amidohydrolase n=1 Tax=Planosporangium flavigriseum TaxID=373681 RepID=A0A8J3LZT8_9ACTN|nr:M20 family metallopeptidase [Planosporangium flavigriseum]GIG76491.1 N-acyl-L-amino acid amidohydrolase [Planosporangium flavigriseum]